MAFGLFPIVSISLKKAFGYRFWSINFSAKFPKKNKDIKQETVQWHGLVLVKATIKTKTQQNPKQTQIMIMIESEREGERERPTWAMHTVCRIINVRYTNK